MCVTLPGESLGPVESLCDDQRRSGLPPVTLRLHPLNEEERQREVHPKEKYYPTTTT